MHFAILQDVQQRVEIERLAQMRNIESPKEWSEAFSFHRRDEHGTG